jgi:hypothetical protein
VKQEKGFERVVCCERLGGQQFIGGKHTGVLKKIASFYI